MKTYNYSLSNFTFEEQSIKEKYYPSISNKILINYANSNNFSITHQGKNFVIVSYDGKNFQ